MLSSSSWIGTSPWRIQLKDEGGRSSENTFVTHPTMPTALSLPGTADAEVMTRQPGFVSTQLHRGIAGSGVFLNYAIWESVADFRAAFTSTSSGPACRTTPRPATVSPHLFRKVDVPGICRVESVRSPTRGSHAI